MDDFRLDKVQRNLNTQSFGRNMLYFKKIDSTSDFAARLALQTENYNLNCPTSDKIYLKGTVISAEQQEKGRGMLEKKWLSPTGGLWFTIINQTGTALKDLSQVTLLSAASMIEVLSNKIVKNHENKINKEHILKKLTVKWPNDIYFNSRKLAGILCESEKFYGNLYLFTGIGINVNFYTNTRSFTGLNAISLLDITGRITDRSCLLAELINEFEDNFKYWQETGDFNEIFKKIEKIMSF